MHPLLNSTRAIHSEPWFLVINILIIICLVLALLLAILYLAIVILNKTCHTVPILLTGHTCVVEILYGSITLSLAIFTWENDRRQRMHEDSLCAFRGYLGYVATALFLYSFVLQAIYRYVLVVHPTRFSWQSSRVQLLLIVSSWIFSILSLLPPFLMGAISYSPDSQVCLVPLRLSFPVIYNMFMVYLIPLTIIIFVYMKIARHVHYIGTCVTPVHTLFQARRNLIVVRRIVIIIVILLILGLPYVIFILMSFVTMPPKYHLRIAILLLDVAQTSIMLVVFIYCQPVMNILLKYLRLLCNRVQPVSM